MDTIFNLAYSSIASLIARSITYPLDTIKTRIQYTTSNNNNTQKNTSNTQGIISKILRRSINGNQLFQGISVALLFSVPASALYLSTYDLAKQKLISKGRDPKSFYVHTTAAIAAESISSILFTPMEVIKLKMQVCSTKVTASKIAKDVFGQYGFLGFYRGYWLTQFVFVPYTITYFITYEKLKDALSSGAANQCAANQCAANTRDQQSNEALVNAAKTFDIEAREQKLNAYNQTLSQSANKERLSFWGYLTSSTISSILAAAISTPPDVIKTNVQIQGDCSALKVIKRLYREGGLKAFSRGMGARIVWAAPSMSLSITIFELLKDNHFS